jgi:hypothetical protein
VATGSTVTRLEASPRGRTVVAYEGTTPWVLDVERGGRPLRSEGRLLGFAGADEAAVVWKVDPVESVWMGRVRVEHPARPAHRDLFGAEVSPYVWSPDGHTRGRILSADTREGQDFLCDLEAETCRHLGMRDGGHPVGAYTVVPPHPLRTLRPDGTGFAFWDAATDVTLRVPDVAYATLLPDGSAVIYRDASGGYHALRPGASPEPLEGLGSMYDSGVFDPPARNGLRAYVTRDGRAVTWDARTGARAVVAEGVGRARLDPGGERLLYTAPVDGAVVAVRILDLVHGTTRHLLTEDVGAFGWSGGGRFAVVTDHQCRPGDEMAECSLARTRLFRTADGTEVPLEGGAAVNTYSYGGDGFSGDEAYLLQHHKDVLRIYSTATGALVHTTTEGMYAGEYPRMSWHADGWFYGENGGRFGPPYTNSFAWDPRTDRRRTIAANTDLHCVMGERRVMGVDLPGLGATRGPLAVWSSAAAQLTRLSEDATATSCVPARRAVLFLEGTARGPGRGALVYRELDTGCTQVLAEGVDGAAYGEGFAVVHGPQGVVRVTLPQR